MNHPKLKPTKKELEFRNKLREAFKKGWLLVNKEIYVENDEFYDIALMMSVTEEQAFEQGKEIAKEFLVK